MLKIGKSLIEIGIIFVVIGFIFVIFNKVPVFRLPGDIVVKKGNFTLYLPIATSIILSIALTMILNLIFRK